MLNKPVIGVMSIAMDVTITNTTVDSKRTLLNWNKIDSFTM